MNIKVEREPARTIVSLSGQLDTLTAVDFEKEVSVLLNSDEHQIVLNCEGLSYVSSAGLRLLLTLQKGMMAKGGTLILEKVQSPIMDIFKITGFSSILTIRQEEDLNKE